MTTAAKPCFCRLRTSEALTWCAGAVTGLVASTPALAGSGATDPGLADWIASIPDYELRFFQRLEQVGNLAATQTVILVAVAGTLLVLVIAASLSLRALGRRLATLPDMRPQRGLAQRLRLSILMWRQARLEREFARLAALPSGDKTEAETSLKPIHDEIIAIARELARLKRNGYQDL